MMFRSHLTVALLACAALPACSRACSVAHIVTGQELVTGADAIVRARAVGYVGFPVFTFWTTGKPDSKVRFQVVETLRGNLPTELKINGYLSDRDDFNDDKVPYTFVRPGGRAGSCIANTYRRGGEYLLFLKVDRDGSLNATWAALSPVNEQLHNDHDPWLLWTREQVRLLGK